MLCNPSLHPAVTHGNGDRKNTARQTKARRIADQKTRDRYLRLLDEADRYAGIAAELRASAKLVHAEATVCNEQR